MRICDVVIKSAEKRKESPEQSKCLPKKSYRNFGILQQSPVIITAVSGYCGESLYGYEVVSKLDGNEEANILHIHVRIRQNKKVY